MIGWLVWGEAVRERRKQRERIWRERDLEAQAERQRRRAPEPGPIEPLEEGEELTPADVRGFVKTLWWGVLIILAIIGVTISWSFAWFALIPAAVAVAWCFGDTGDEL